MSALELAAAQGEYFYRHAVGREPTRPAQDRRRHLRAALDFVDVADRARAYDATIDAVVVSRLVVDDRPVVRVGEAGDQALALDLLSLVRCEAREQ